MKLRHRLLRDYFAAHALAGWLASFAEASARTKLEMLASPLAAKTIASHVYELADAMLVERRKP